MKAIDLSNLQRAITVDDLRKLDGDGIGLVFVGCQYPGPGYPAGDAHLDFAALMSYGGRIAGAPYFEDTPVEEAWPHIAFFQPFMAPFGAVAVEDGSAFTDEATIDAQFAALRAHGLQPVLYTSPYMLQKYGLVAALRRWIAEGVLIWLAAYDETDNLIVRNWTGPLWAKQYSAHGDVGLDFEVDLDEVNMQPAAPAMEVVPSQPPAAAIDEDSMANRIKVEGTQDIGLLNDVAAKALGALAASNESGGVSAYVRYGPSVDLSVSEEELIIRVPQGTFHVGQA